MTALPPAGSCTKLHCSFSICASDTSEHTELNSKHSYNVSHLKNKKNFCKNRHTVYISKISDIFEQKYPIYPIYINVIYRRYISSQPWPFIISILGLDIAYLCSKFDDCSFSHSRDTVGAHQNFIGLCDLTAPLSGMICHPWASTINLPTKCELSYSTQYVDMKSDTKYQNWDGLW